jgi:tRNA (cmo5U34)-methyltransferase
MNEFDIKAAGWDENPMHQERSAAIAAEILKYFPPGPDSRALEFGAGTGILSFLLREHFKEIILIDNSSEMIRIINEKISASGAGNLKTIFFDLEHSDMQDEKFDFIFTQMAMHHVSDIENMIRKFHYLLLPGGFLAIADLFSEDGSFHGEGFNGHNGFDPDDFAGILTNNNFTRVSHKECFAINRKVSESETKIFPVFLITAQSI